MHGRNGRLGVLQLRASLPSVRCQPGWDDPCPLSPCSHTGLGWTTAVLFAQNLSMLGWTRAMLFAQHMSTLLWAC